MDETALKSSKTWIAKLNLETQQLIVDLSAYYRIEEYESGGNTTPTLNKRLRSKVVTSLTQCATTGTIRGLPAEIFHHDEIRHAIDYMFRLFWMYKWFSELDGAGEVVPFIGEIRARKDLDPLKFDRILAEFAKNSTGSWQQRLSRDKFVSEANIYRDRITIQGINLKRLGLAFAASEDFVYAMSSRPILLFKRDLKVRLDQVQTAWARAGRPVIPALILAKQAQKRGQENLEARQFKRICNLKRMRAPVLRPLSGSTVGSDAYDTDQTEGAEFGEFTQTIETTLEELSDAPRLEPVSTALLTASQDVIDSEATEAQIIEYLPSECSISEPQTDIGLLNSVFDRMMTPGHHYATGILEYVNMEASSRVAFMEILNQSAPERQNHLVRGLYAKRQPLESAQEIIQVSQIGTSGQTQRSRYG